MIFHCVHGPHCYVHPSVRPCIHASTQPSIHHLSTHLSSIIHPSPILPSIHPSMYLPNHPSVIHPSIHPSSTIHPSIHPSCIHLSSHPHIQPASHQWALGLHLTLGSWLCWDHRCTNKCPSPHLCIYPTIHPSSTIYPSYIHPSSHPHIQPATHQWALGLHLTLGSAGTIGVQINVQVPTQKACTQDSVRTTWSF